ncbi:unnamed protein product [Chrysoparadoxa australica]
MKRYLIYFGSCHADFRVPELQALCELCGVDPASMFEDSEAESKALREKGPLLVVNLPSEEVACKILSRSVCVRRALELWGAGITLEEAVKDVKDYPQELIRPYCEDDSLTWGCQVGAINYKLKEEEQRSIREHFRFLAFSGTVALKNPQQVFWVLEEFTREPSYRPNRDPLAVYFGREIGTTSRDLINSLTLKKRCYLGPTSMDNELSLIMANMALARKGALVMDPFVGTGSILVACAQMGGSCCIGTDIDIRVLRGKGEGDVFSNFDQYGLPRPEVVRSDNSLYHRHFRRMPGRGGLYDAVVCDPPYGVRAGARKCGTTRAPMRKQVDSQTTQEELNSLIPRTQVYAISDVMADLLVVAADILVLGGRLCYLIPSQYDVALEDLPKHPCLEMVAHSMQPLGRVCRRLITMRKIAVPSSVDGEG